MSADIEAALGRVEELDAVDNQAVSALETERKTLFDYVKSHGGLVIRPDDELSVPTRNGGC